MRVSSPLSSRNPAFDADSELQKLVDAGFDELARPKTAKPAAKVIRLREPEPSLDDEMPVAFAEEELAFLSTAAAFLRGRANRDLLMEEIWAMAETPPTPTPLDLTPTETKQEGDA